MYKIKNSDIPFLTLSKENFFTICNSLEYDEIGIIFKAFMDYVYFGIEPTFEKKYMRGIFDGVLQTMERKAEGCFASRENGKKGGRPKKNNTDLQPNTDFEEKAEISPNETIEPQNDIVLPHEEESVSEAQKQGEFDNVIEEFENNIENEENMGNYIGYIPNYGAAVEVRKEVTEYNVDQVLECLSTKQPCLYNKMLNTPLKSLSVDDNMKRMKESLDGSMRDIFKDETQINSIYIHIINKKIN